MDQSSIDRINALYHKSQAVGLTEEEKEEQARLRKEYIAVSYTHLDVYKRQDLHLYHQRYAAGKDRRKVSTV